MTKYNSLNVKVSNSQLLKLKSAIKNDAEVVLKLSSNMVRNYDAINFPYKLLLTTRQVANLCKTFANNSTTGIKLSKISVIYDDKILGSGKRNTTTLIISNDEMEDIIMVVKPLEDSGLLLKGVSETIQNEAREEKQVPRFVKYMNKRHKNIMFHLKLKKIIPFLFSMLKFVEKKINLPQAFSEKIRSVAYTVILIAF